MVHRVTVNLSDKVALVTGASRGIGQQIARELGLCGAAVAVHYLRDKVGADELVSDLNQNAIHAISVPADVGDASAVERMFASVERSLGPVSILVNSAGMETEATLDRLGYEEWCRVLTVNLTGPFLCMQRAVQVMPTGGSILNISSIHSTVARKGAAHYCASKAGLEMLSRTAALELAGRGIRVNCIAPGAILTDMNRELIETVIGPEKWREWIPLGRVGSTEDVATLAAFLVSDLAAYITGEVITVDGAYSLNLVRYD